MFGVSVIRVVKKYTNKRITAICLVL